MRVDAAAGLAVIDSVHGIMQLSVVQQHRSGRRDSSAHVSRLHVTLN